MTLVDEKCRFLVRVSYLEIYNEEVRDLLSKNVHNRLEIRERADIGVYVQDLLKFSVKNPEDMDRLMAIGNKHSKYEKRHNQILCKGCSWNVDIFF